MVIFVAAKAGTDSASITAAPATNLDAVRAFIFMSFSSMPSSGRTHATD